MRVGVLTGGGDCPGLNAVIRAVVRKGVRTHGFEFVGYRDGWKGPLEGITMELGIEQCRGILPRGGTILGSSRTNPFKIDGRRRADPGEPQERRGRRAGRDRRRGHPRRGHQAGRPRGERGRRTEDDRQRPVRHRLHVRLRHRRQHRHRGDRPAAHHGRVAPPGARRRGDGPARRLDRAALRHRRRRQRRTDPGAPVRHRRALCVRRGPVQDPVLADHRRVRGRRPRRRRRHDAGLGGEGRVRPRPARRHRRPARARDRDPDRQGGPRGRARPHPARRHADGVRPLAGHPLRAAGHRRRRRGRLREDDGAARHQHRPGAR